MDSPRLEQYLICKDILYQCGILLSEALVATLINLVVANQICLLWGLYTLYLILYITHLTCFNQIKQLSKISQLLRRLYFLFILLFYQINTVIKRVTRFNIL